MTLPRHLSMSALEAGGWRLEAGGWGMVDEGTVNLVQRLRWGMSAGGGAFGGLVEVKRSCQQAITAGSEEVTYTHADGSLCLYPVMVS
ncbi:hypothetical protein EYF80_005469 [Liparis tanakae]|uniref:Uncharacterized protein n=1 Tax=Liparis tanakae TaxID=230148 RepID=A0A4Z2J3V7_9TELE|nr:hypothetical protein EYF80_005469 [Liparis tanakae]